MALLLDELDMDFSLYGINTTINTEYQFVYHLNRHALVKFSRIEDLDVKIQNQLFCFSLFHFEHESLQADFYLMKNQSHHKTLNNPQSLFESEEMQAFLLPRYKNFNYLLKINAEGEENVINTLYLEQLAIIQSTVQIDTKQLKEKQRLIF